MYALLRRFLPPTAAAIALGCWYAALIVLLLLFGATPENTIRYMEL